VAVPTELISAAIGAVSGAGVSVWTYRASLAHQRNREVREQLLQIVDLRAQQSELNQTKPVNYLEASGLLNSKRTLYLAIANELAEKAHRSLTPNDCMLLGFESYSDGDARTARRHFERAVSKARHRRVSVVTRVEALRYLGAYFLGPGPDQDPARGSRCYREAVELTDGDPNPYFVYATAVSIEQWGRALGGSGDEGWRALVERARRTYEQLPVEFHYRAASLVAVDALLGQTTEAVQPPPLSAAAAEPPRSTVA
jgi:hypothetical protein